jgi:hypothetical protein
MNVCKLEIFFRFIELNNAHMGVKIQYNGIESVLNPVDESVYCYEQEITLPCSIHLEFFGKDTIKDTKIDEHGNILKDKHVLIKSIKLDNFPIEPLYLKRRLELVHNNGTNYSNYIGFNGHMEIKFEKSNVFAQVLHMKRLGEF